MMVKIHTYVQAGSMTEKSTINKDRKGKVINTGHHICGEKPMLRYCNRILATVRCL